MIRSFRHNPAHPGEILRALYMEPLGVTIGQAAEAMKLSRKHVSSIVNGRAAVTADMALRLGAAFGTDAELWLNPQAQHDLAHARPSRGIRTLVRRRRRARIATKKQNAA